METIAPSDSRIDSSLGAFITHSTEKGGLKGDSGFSIASMKTNDTADLVSQHSSMLPKLHPRSGLNLGGLSGFQEIIESDRENEERPLQDEELVVSSSSDNRSKETESQKKESEKLTDQSLPPIY